MTKSMKEPPRHEGSMKQTWHVLGSIGPLFSDGGLKNWELLLGRDRLLARPLGIGLSLKAGVMAGIGGGLGIDLPVHLPLSVHLSAFATVLLKCRGREESRERIPSVQVQTLQATGLAVAFVQLIRSPFIALLNALIQFSAWPHSATVRCGICSSVADSGTAWTLTSLAMAPKLRLNILPAA